MSTRSLIGIKQDNLYKYIYCHFDGYPEGIGKELKTYYNSEELANNLVDCGDLESIDDGVATLIEDGRRPRICRLDQIPDQGQEYVYIWENDKWSTYQYIKHTIIKEN